MTPVYVAGPYAAPTPDLILQNVVRASIVGWLAVDRGLAPVVPHLLGWGGLYGDPNEGDSRTRELALRCSRTLAYSVGVRCGEIWVIERDDGTLSSGTEAELEEFGEGFRDAGGVGISGCIRRETWDVWAYQVARVTSIDELVERQTALLRRAG